MGDFQHGFRKGGSTVSAAANFLNTVYEQINQGKRVAGVFLDLTKSFD